jgi:hypothetical protein
MDSARPDIAAESTDSEENEATAVAWMNPLEEGSP